MALHITHLATTAADGAGIAARRIHQSLLNAGAGSRLLVRDHGNTGAETQVAGMPPPSFAERLARKLPFPMTASLKHERRLRALLARRGPAPELFSLPYARSRPETHEWTRESDIVHLHWVSGFIDYRRFFVRAKTQLVWTLHDQQPYLGGFHYEIDHASHPAFHAIEAECRALKQHALTRLARPLLVIGNSLWNTETARKSRFFPEDTRFQTVYYPLDIAAYAPRDKTSAKIALGLAPESLVIGFACTGLENTRKGLADLLAALRHLESMPGLPAFTLLSFGRAPSDTLRATLRSPWRHLGFLDADTVKCAAYAAMDCFVIPSRAEAFGQTAIEALASGTCVLGADVGGIPETMPASCHADALFPAGDVPALATRLRTLLSDHPARSALASQGLEHVRRQHSPARIAAQLIELYDSLTSRA